MQEAAFAPYSIRPLLPCGKKAAGPSTALPFQQVSGSVSTYLRIVICLLSHSFESYPFIDSQLLLAPLILHPEDFHIWMSFNSWVTCIPYHSGSTGAMSSQQAF